jgi:hypothetical protein
VIPVLFHRAQALTFTEEAESMIRTAIEHKDNFTFD